MNLDYALNRLSLALESVHPLGYFAAGRIVNGWFSVLDPLMALLNKLPDIPIPAIEQGLVVILGLLIAVFAVVAVAAIFVLMIGSAIASIVCADLNALLGHAIAIWHALAAVRAG